MLAACAALAVLVGVGGWALLGSSAGCDKVPLNVAASPDVAAVLDGIAGRFNDSKQRIDGSCAEVRISAQSSAETANSLIGSEPSAAPAPQVWIPDSSIWVDQVREILKDKKPSIPAENTSLATSPTVIAMPGPVANQIGGGSGRVGWARLLQELGSERPLKVGFLDPAFNTTGVAALLAVNQLLGQGADARVKQTEFMRTLNTGGVVGKTPQDVLDKLPESADSAVIQQSVGAVPISEQAVWRYNADKPAVPLRSVYPSEGALRLDYPYVVTLDKANAKQQKAADRFLKELGSPESRKELAENGFRTPEGKAGEVLNQENGVDPAEPKSAPRPSPQAVATSINAWRVLTLATRMLALVDVSGSMTQPVPGTGKSRMEVTVSAAQQGLGLFGGTSELGLWTFSTKLAGNRDYKEQVSLGPLDGSVQTALGPLSRRGAVAEALARIQAKPGGATGLYDTILAAYRSMNKSYQPDKVNAVVVFTDGENEDPGSITLDGLLAELRKEFDRSKPIPIYIIAFGPDSDIVSARKISEVTTGAAYQANTASEISKVFLDAVGQRQCRPNC